MHDHSYSVYWCLQSLSEMSHKVNPKWFFGEIWRLMFKNHYSGKGSLDFESVTRAIRRWNYVLSELLNVSNTCLKCVSLNVFRQSLTACIMPYMPWVTHSDQPSMPLISMFPNLWRPEIPKRLFCILIEPSSTGKESDNNGFNQFNMIRLKSRLCHPSVTEVRYIYLIWHIIPFLFFSHNFYKYVSSLEVSNLERY